MTIQRGEIYFVNLNPVQGREQAGQRPVLVLSIDAINRAPFGRYGRRRDERRKHPTRLCDQYSGSARGQWPTNGDCYPGVQTIPNQWLKPSLPFTCMPRVGYEHAIRY
jgi:PemK-like, MazF-like toxin of type II toxin-antitoxin system